jgi:hypothetical protein
MMLAIYVGLILCVSGIICHLVPDSVCRRVGSIAGPNIVPAKLVLGAGFPRAGIIMIVITLAISMIANFVRPL